MQRSQNRPNKILELLHSLVIGVVFLLLCRSISPYHTDYVPEVKQVYETLARICGIAVVVIFLTQLRKVPKAMPAAFAAVYGVVLLSTIAHGGNLTRFGQAACPVLAMTAFVAVECSTLRGTRRFLRTMTDLFLVIETVNLVLMLYNRELFGVTAQFNGYIYLLGGENLIGYGLMMGFFVAVLNHRVNGQRWKLQLYTALFWFTTMYNFSVGSVLGALFPLVYFLFPRIRKAFEKWPFGVFVAVIAGCFVVLVFLSDWLVGLPPVRYLIEDVLGKNLTFSGRTDIWAVVKQALAENPIWGYGVQDTSRVFKITVWKEIRYVSAHNQYLQSWYEGGIFTIAALIVSMLVGGVLLKKSPDRRICGETKAFATGILAMLLVEAAGYDALFFIVNLGVAVSLTLSREQQRMAFRRKTATAPEELVTVVIPVEEQGAEVPACLDGIVNQSYANLEILLVHSGDSPWLPVLAEGDSRIRVVQQTEEGLVGARKAGIQAAAGSYVTFVEPDSNPRREMIHYLLRLTRANRADLAVCGREIWNKKGIPQPGEPVVDRVVSGTGRCVAELMKTDQIGSWTGGKLIDAAMLKEGEWSDEELSGDMVFAFGMVARCKRMAVGGQALYRCAGKAASGKAAYELLRQSQYQLEQIRKSWPRLESAARCRVVETANDCVKQTVKTAAWNSDLVAGVQKCYRANLWPYLTGNDRVRDKLLALAGFVRLDWLLELLAAWNNRKR